MPKIDDLSYTGARGLDLQLCGVLESIQLRPWSLEVTVGGTSTDFGFTLHPSFSLDNECIYPAASSPLL